MTHHTSHEQALVIVPELAAFLRVPVSCVYVWTRAVGPDAIPAYRAGKRLVFDREEALAWFKRTQRKEALGAHLRVLPDTRPDGQRRKGPVRRRVAANGQAAVATVLPQEGSGGVRWAK